MDTDVAFTVDKQIDSQAEIRPGKGYLVVKRIFDVFRACWP